MAHTHKQTQRRVTYPGREPGRADLLPMPRFPAVSSRDALCWKLFLVALLMGTGVALLTVADDDAGMLGTLRFPAAGMAVLTRVKPKTQCYKINPEE